VSDVNRGLPITIDDGTHKYVYGLGLGLAYAVSGSTVEVYHTDRLGSVRAITDATAVVTATYRTDEWGVPTSTTGNSTQLFRFTGEPVDATCLAYLRARFYDPALGRFLSRDPWPGHAEQPDQLNRFAYAQSNPTSYADHSGRCIEFLFVSVIGGGTVLVGAAVSGGCILAVGAATVVGAGLGFIFGNSVIDQKQGQSIPKVYPPPLIVKPLPLPPLPQLPKGDPVQPDPPNGMSGKGAVLLVLIGVSVVVDTIFGWDVHLGEPEIEEEGTDNKSNVLGGR
jgi:RHS repeat-associated protein